LPPKNYSTIQPCNHSTIQPFTDLTIHNHSTKCPTTNTLLGGRGLTRQSSQSVVWVANAVGSPSPSSLLLQSVFVLMEQLRGRCDKTTDWRSN